MILVCPSCDTRYFADDASLGSEGRRVRCASCGHSWFARPTDGDVATAESAGLTREQVERLRKSAASTAARVSPHSEFRAKEQARRQKQRALAALVGWIGGAALFAGAAGAIVMQRDKVVTAWPRTASFFSMVGLKVNRFGLEFVDVAAKRSFDGTTPVLTVTGSARNPGPGERPAPDVRVSLRDEAGKEVHAWTTPMEAASIPGGGAVPFSARLVSPPLETVGIEVTFVPANLGDADAGHGADGHSAGPHAAGGHGDDAHSEDGAPAAAAHGAEGDAAHAETPEAETSGDEAPDAHAAPADGAHHDSGH